MELAIMAIATAFNIIIIKWKYEHDRILDATMDAILLALLAFVFGGSLGGMAIATASSAIISLYLIFSPFRISE